MVVEACEYRANFLNFHPRCAVILGIEPDHFDCYDTVEQLEHAFGLFGRAVRADGRLLVRHECPRSRTVAEAACCRVETFGLAEGADWRAIDLCGSQGRYAFTACHAGRALCRMDLRVLGAHHVMNALAAVAVGVQAGAPAELAAEELSRWAGLERRLEIVGEAAGITWVNDYAHHPTEVRAALGAVREAFPGRKIHCLFEPHQASRTARLLDETAASLQNADCAWITEIFRAREPIPSDGDITAADLAACVRERGTEVPPIHNPADCGEHLAHRLRSGDVLVTLGAGDVGKIGYELFEQVRANCAAG